MMKISPFAFAITALTLLTFSTNAKAQIADSTRQRADEALEDAYQKAQRSLPLPQPDGLFSIVKTPEARRAIQDTIASHDADIAPFLLKDLETSRFSGSALARLKEIPREQVQRAIQDRLQNPAPVLLGRPYFATLGSPTEAEAAAINAELDKRQHAALAADPDPKRRAFYALRGLLDSEGLRQDPLFWHEFFIHAAELEPYQYRIASLLDTPSWESSPRIEKYPIQMDDIKFALESSPFYSQPQAYTIASELDLPMARMHLGQPSLAIFLKLVQHKDPTWANRFLLQHITARNFPFAPAALANWSEAERSEAATRVSQGLHNPDTVMEPKKRTELEKRLIMLTGRNQKAP